MERKLKKEDLSDLGIFVDTFGKKRNGNYIVRNEFYYRMGRSAEKIAESLKDKFSDINIVDMGENWKSFRGGASVANSSHFYVEFNFN